MGPEYKPGDVIEYRTFGGILRVARVVARDADIQHGRPGFDGTLVSTDRLRDGAKVGQDVWGYDAQITRVMTRS